MKVICRLDNKAIKNDTVEIRSCGAQFPGCVQIVKDDASVVVNAYDLRTAVDNCVRDHEYPNETLSKRIVFGSDGHTRNYDRYFSGYRYQEAEDAEYETEDD